MGVCPATRRPERRASLFSNRKASFMKRLSAALCGLVLAAAWVLPASVEAGRLGRAVVPTFEAVDLQVDAEQADYGGAVRLTLDVREPVDHFSLHAREMTLESVTLEGPGGPIETTHEVEGDLLTVRAGAPLAVGQHTLAIDFEGPFNTQAVALYRMEQDGLGYAFTQFEAADARKCFPCFDEPGFKVPYEVTLLVPEGMEALANTPEVARDTTGGHTTVRFEGTRPLPTYLVAFAVGPFDVVRCQEKTRVPIRAITPKGKGRLVGTALSFIPGILSTLEGWFGLPYPYPKLDVVAVPEFGAGAMENAGLITYREELLLSDTELNRVYLLRNFLSDMPPAEAIEFLLTRMKRTERNQEFLDSMAQGE